MSVLDFATFGASLSVRSLVRCGSNVKVDGGKLTFTNDNTFIQETGAGVEIEVQGGKAMTLTSTGGSMHGTWIANSPITTSDRRLKENIRPLMGAVEENHPEQQDKNWLLRELRPVAYSFKNDESKRVRFGFIADEVEKLLPQVVRDLPQAGHKGIVYNDLIAVVTSMMKDLSSEVKDLVARVQAAEQELDRMED